MMGLQSRGPEGLSSHGALPWSSSLGWKQVVVSSCMGLTGKMCSFIIIY